MILLFTACAMGPAAPNLVRRAPASEDTASTASEVPVVDELVPGPVAPIDVLFVIDDDATTEITRDQLGEMSGLLLVSAARFDLRFGVITTDGSGALRAAADGRAFVDGLTSDPETRLGDLLQIETRNGTPNRGFDSIFAVFEGDANSFRRPGSDLHVVVVSNAEDESPGLHFDAFAYRFEALRAPGGALTLSLLVELPASTQYGDAARAFDGLVGDAPPEDWLLQVLESDFIQAPRARTFPLSARPVDPNDIQVSRASLHWDAAEAWLERDIDWRYDLSPNTITLLRGVPRPDEVIRIRYEPL
ncbi:MAG: hypothetical protein AAGA48_11370 [Myxococcota bacterium]